MIVREATIQHLRECLDYNPRTGALTWRERPRSHFKNDGVWAAWNKKHSHTEVFSRKGGYLSLKVDGVQYLAHRVAWAMETGEWPKGGIDHINGDKSDNRISNIRDVSPAENSKNKVASKNNTSGFIGIGWNKASKKWMAYIGSGSGQLHLGLFSDINDAIAARKAAEQALGYHQNHGRRA